MENACRGAARRLSCVAALILAGPIAAAEPAAGPADTPEPALLQFLGETSGLDPELMRFMESREARRAVKDAAKKEGRRRRTRRSLPTSSRPAKNGSGLQVPRAGKR